MQTPSKQVQPPQQPPHKTQFGIALSSSRSLSPMMISAFFRVERGADFILKAAGRAPTAGGEYIGCHTEGNLHEVLKSDLC
jgi:hypothetical protein